MSEMAIMRRSRRYSIPCSILEKDKGIMVIENEACAITAQVKEGILQIEVEETELPETLKFEYLTGKED